MKALTVQQPWAWAIIHGGKTIENRTLRTSYRGPLAIHAGLREDTGAYDDEMIREALGHVDDSWTLQEQLDTGAILGVVDLVAIHHDSDHGRGDRARCSWWAQSDQWHWQVANPRPLAQPVRCRGQLQLWEPPMAAVLEQLQAVR